MGKEKMVLVVVVMGNAKEKTLIPPCHPLFLKKIDFY
jgi:molybdenum cofactor biosynthesis enzyme